MKCSHRWRWAVACRWRCAAVCEDDDQLLEILSRVRMAPTVTSTETFVYLKLRKQTYSWGTR